MEGGVQAASAMAKSPPARLPPTWLDQL